MGSEENNNMAIQKAAFAGIHSVEKLISMIDQHNNIKNQQRQENVVVIDDDDDDLPEVGTIADDAVKKLKEVISHLDKPRRVGHARFRRTPPTKRADPPAPIHVLQPMEKAEQVSSAFKVYRPAPLQAPLPLPLPLNNNHHYPPFFPPQQQKNEAWNGFSTFKFPSLPSLNSLFSPANSYVPAFFGGSESLQTPFVPSGFQITHVPPPPPPPPPQGSSHMPKPPPFPAPLKKNCNPTDVPDVKPESSTARCRCSRRRKLKLNRRVIRVPAISLVKNSEIPRDENLWRKYGQKPIKGSPYPRGYYKCSTVKGCPARKHVERARDERNMFIVTYEGEHDHSLAPLLPEVANHHNDVVILESF